MGKKKISRNFLCWDLKFSSMRLDLKSKRVKEYVGVQTAAYENDEAVQSGKNDVNLNGIKEGSSGAGQDGTENKAMGDTERIELCKTKETDDSKKKEYLQQLFIRFWKSKVNRINASGLINERKALAGIEENDIDVLYQFYLKWYRESEEKDEKQLKKKESFYYWLESNYMQHLIAHQRHKKGYFSRAIKGIKSYARFQGIDKIFKIGLSLLSMGGVTVWLPKHIDLEKWNSLLDGLPLGNKVLPVSLVIVMVVLLSLIICFTSSYMKLTYNQKIDRVVDSKGTWLRHQKAIVEYQREMIDYVYEIGIYSNMGDQYRDERLMNRVRAVWETNAEKFQKNMENQQPE